MPSPILTVKRLTQSLRGLCVTDVSVGDEMQFVLHFSDGTTLAFDKESATLSAGGGILGASGGSQGLRQPSKRQLEYLAFIARYIERFGRAPAESDIQRHFLVSAPSVNQMIQTLERHGFIERRPGVARSMRISSSLSQKTPI